MDTTTESEEGKHKTDQESNEEFHFSLEELANDTQFEHTKKNDEIVPINNTELNESNPIIDEIIQIETSIDDPLPSYPVHTNFVPQPPTLESDSPSPVIFTPLSSNSQEHFRSPVFHFNGDTVLSLPRLSQLLQTVESYQREEKYEKLKKENELLKRVLLSREGGGGGRERPSNRRKETNGS